MSKKAVSKSIAILVCYLGKLPWYFEYFIHSCKYNPYISFFIITDDKSFPNEKPANVHFVYKSLEEINKIATRKLGFQTNIKTGYKLCDFKPAYGYIFDDIVMGYDFWGHADIDIIFGDIRSFITDDLLSNYELISVRHDFLTGQFLLFKNDQKMNTLFTQSKDYKKVLSSEKHYCFDETNFKWDEFTNGIQYTEIDSEIESMTHVVKRMQEQNKLKAHFDFLIIEGLPGKLKWERGKIYYKGKFEVLMYHMVLFKKHGLRPKKSGILPDTFFISPTRIYHMSNGKKSLA